MPIFDTSLPAADLAAPAPETANPATATDAQPEDANTNNAEAAPATDTPVDDAEAAAQAPAPTADNPDEKAVDWKKRYGDLRRELSKQRQPQQPSQSVQTPQPTSAQQPELDPNFVEQWNRDPKGTIERLATDMAMRQSRQLVEPLLRAEAEKNYATNMQSVAGDYPEVVTDAGYAPFAAALQAMAREWGAEHLVYNPPLELMEAAARRAFGGKGRTYLAARAAGKQETMEQIRAKQGLGTTTTKPKTTARTPEDELADSIVSAGRPKGIFGK